MSAFRRVTCVFFFLLLARLALAIEPGEVQILHDPLLCWPTDQFRFVDVAFEPPADLLTAKLYYRSAAHADYYFVELTLGRDGRGRAILPMVEPDAPGVVYFLELVTKSFTAFRTDETNVPVSSGSECQGLDPTSVFYTGPNPDIAVGATRAGVPALPPDFQPNGIARFISVAGPTPPAGPAAGGGGVSGKTVGILAGGGGAGAAALLFLGGNAEATTTTGLGGNPTITTTAATTTATGGGPTSTTTTVGGGPSSTTTTAVGPTTTTTGPGTSTTTGTGTTTSGPSSTTTSGPSTTTTSGPSTTTSSGPSTTTSSGPSTTTTSSPSTTTTSSPSSTTSGPTTSVSSTTSSVSTSTTSSSSSTTTSASATSDLAITGVSQALSGSSAPVAATYTINFVNQAGSTEPSPFVSISIAPPPSGTITFASASGGCNSVSGGGSPGATLNVNCGNVGSMAVGAPKQIVLIVGLLNSGSYSLSASISGSNVDPNLGNNSGGITSVVALTTDPSEAARVATSFVAEIVSPSGWAQANFALNGQTHLTLESGSPRRFDTVLPVGEVTLTGVAQGSALQGAVWRFDFTAAADHFEQGSLVVDAGAVLATGSHHVVFRLDGTEARIRFRFRIRR